MSGGMKCTGKHCADCTAHRCPSVVHRRHDGWSLVERLVLGDAHTLISTLAVPREYCIAVVVKSEMEPNSGVNWAGYRDNSLACTQVLFFDSRRRIEELERLVIDSTILHHTWEQETDVRFNQLVVDSRHCACGRERCPGSAHRSRLLTARMHCAPALSGAFNEVSAPHTECGLASPGYTRLATAATHLTFQRSSVMEARAASESIANACAQTVAEYWQIYDETTGYPLLLGADDDSDNSAHGARFAADPMVALFATDAPSVMAAHAQSHHKTPLCAARLLQTLTQHSSHPNNASQSFVEQLTNSVDRDLLFRLLHGAILAASKKGVSHVDDDNCCCLIHHYIETRCAEQVLLTLVALPTNPLYAEAGDSIADIESESARMLMCNQAAEALQVQGRMTRGAIDWRAKRGAPNHYDTVLMKNAAMQGLVSARAGRFTRTYDAINDRFNFHRLGPARDTSVEFRRYCARQKNAVNTVHAGLYRTAQTQKLASMSYAAVLDASKRFFGVADAQSLSEIALKRGLFGDGKLLASLEHWLPPAAKHCVEHSIRSPDDIVECVHRILESGSEPAQRLILSTTCEQRLLSELQLTDNRRLVMARITGLFFKGLRHEASDCDYSDAVIYLTAAVLLLHQCDELATHLLRPPPTPPPPKKAVKTPVPRPQQPKKKKPAKIVAEKPPLVVVERKEQFVERKEQFDEFMLRLTQVDFFDFLRDPAWVAPV